MCQLCPRVACPAFKSLITYNMGVVCVFVMISIVSGKIFQERLLLFGTYFFKRESDVK